MELLSTGFENWKFSVIHICSDRFISTRAHIHYHVYDHDCTGLHCGKAVFRLGHRRGDSVWRSCHCEHRMHQNPLESDEVVILFRNLARKWNQVKKKQKKEHFVNSNRILTFYGFSDLLCAFEFVIITDFELKLKRKIKIIYILLLIIIQSVFLVLLVSVRN